MNKQKTVKNSKLQTLFRLLLGVALTYAGISHILWNRSEFLAQVPNWLHIDADIVVVLSGIVEITLGLCLLLLAKRKPLIGLIVAMFFILIFPGNISQYLNEIDAFGLNSDRARLIRLVFQPVLVVWALWSTGAWSIYCKKRVGINKNK
ncbi:MAG: hypothetical protein HRT66_09705 [Flavobacteriaceae bacterium]|nr:hypothetical protein [Flavobacteriaceae bacterium]